MTYKRTLTALLLAVFLSGCTTFLSPDFGTGTRVGAYIINGTNNSVQTFVDTAVFDVGSGRLLSRASGVDEHSERTTAIVTADAAFDRNRASFDAAMHRVAGNLDAGLSDLERRVRDNAELVRVSYRQGYAGGGSFDGLLILLLVGVAIGGISWRPESSADPR